MPVIVTALQDRRFRAGREFGRVPVEFADGVLTAPELAALQADPLLIVDTSQNAATLNARIDGIIRGLHFRDFTVDGKPKVAELNAVLKEAEIPALDTAARDAAVVRLLAAGWTAPADPDA
jgi:hypothetical protein